MRNQKKKKEKKGVEQHNKQERDGTGRIYIFLDIYHLQLFRIKEMNMC